MRKLLIFWLFLTFGVKAQNPLLIPDTLSGTSFTLNLQTGTYQFLSGAPTNTMGVNGNILGPTLLLQNGDSINISVVNNLPDTTTIHWHGMHVSAENDGGPHTTIPPGTTWKPGFKVRDKAATYWYHPHLHKKTDKHVSMGIAGLILVRDSEEAALTLPRTYGQDDFPLVIQTKDLDTANQIVVHSNSDDLLMVNATLNPYLDVPAQVVRFRILNGSSQRVFNLGLTNDKTFYQIATDGGLLSAPLSLTRLMLSPGERAEILIDFSGQTGDTLYLMSYASELPNGIYGAQYPGMNSIMTLNGYDPNPLNGADFNILQFNVVAPTANPVTTIPSSLVTVTPIPEASASTTRTLTFSPEIMGPNQLNGNFLINNASFDMNIINYTIPLNNVEIWELTNQSAIAHPFHIHDVQFYILDRNGNPPALSEQGRKDVVLVRPLETVRFITKFETFADDSVPYMYHCHMLTHEDMGMMGQFVVTTTTNLTNIINNSSIKIYPVPASQTLTIQSEKEKIRQAEFFNVLGKKIYSPNISPGSISHIPVSNLPQGVYILKIETDSRTHFSKIVIE